MGAAAGTLVIACGALAREIVALRQLNDWPYMDVQCLPADLHNRPEKIPSAVGEKIRANKSRYGSIFVAYADCGTGGLLDQVLAEEGVERIPGAHCYEFFAGGAAFAVMAEAEPGTFYLTDFLLRHFERLILRGLGIDRHPELLNIYFGNYRKLTFLAQTETPGGIDDAKRAAARLGLEFEYRFTGYGELKSRLQDVNMGVIQWQN